MLKKIGNLTNAETLTKETQSKMYGGIMISCDRSGDCPPGWLCISDFCCPSHIA